MKKILVILSLLLFTCGISYAGWIEENESGCTNSLYCGTLTNSGTTTTSALVVSSTITDIATTTPTVTGQIALDAATYGVYIATNTVSYTDWVLIGGQS